MMKSVDTFLKKVSSWDDLWDFSKTLTKQEKGYLFERLTELILLTKPEYVSLVKNVYRQGKGIYSELRDYLNLPNTDEGIDLIAETYRGEYWAIQCKFKGDNSAPTYKEISTFGNLAHNYCQNISRSFLFHTGEKGVLKKKLLGESFNQVGLEFWLALQSDDWERIRSKVAGKAIRPTKRLPRPHQLKAIQAAKEHFLKNRACRGKLIMPCGTGKSLTAFWIAESLKAKTIVVAVPSLSLIKQTLEDWTRELLATSNRNRPEWLCICSDDSTGKLEKDEFVSDVYSLGIPTTTDKEIIKSFLARSTKGQKIVFTTYQSSERLAQASKYLNFEFDLAILDEAHKTVGEKTKTFATLLLDKNIKVKQRIFMTATERIIRGANDEVLSMDDKSIYGDRFYLLTFKDAIHSDPPIISDYKILTVMVTNDEIKELITKNKLLTDKSRVYEEKESQSLAAAVALRKCYDKYGIRHAVSFHSSIARAKDFAQLNESMTKSGKFKRLNNYHISSKKSAGERASLIKEFASHKPSLITNARCLTEGVDVPSIDCVLFADPRQSIVDIVQAVGRALRTAPDKKFGYILLPIIVPDGMDIEEFSNSTPYRQIVRIITALSTQDERIAEELRITNKNKNKLRNRIIKTIGSIPVSLKITTEELISHLETRIWETVGKANWRTFTEARNFVHTLKLKNEYHWRDYSKTSKKPPDIPATPSTVYANYGWRGFGDWLGTGRIANFNREYWPFNEAKKYVQSLKLKNQKEWKMLKKSGNLPLNIPSHPHIIYQTEGWKNWGDWFGTNAIATSERKYRSFKDARAYVHSLKLSNSNEWKIYCKTGKLPLDIPTNPHRTYKKVGWESYGDWLGNGEIAKKYIEYLSFHKARRYVHQLGLISQNDWIKYCQSGLKPSNIPTAPWNVYKNKGWTSMGDFFGTNTLATYNRNYRDFNAAKNFIRKQNIPNFKSWVEYCMNGKKPNDVPSNPQRVYRDNGWLNWNDWLGNKNKSTQKRSYRSFRDARTYVHSLKIKSRAEWRVYCKSGQKPEDIPTNPAKVYKSKGWINETDWLGTSHYAANKHIKQSRQ